MPNRTNSKRRQTLDRWTTMLQQRLPALSLPEAKGLALWSIGIVLAKACSLHAVVLALACWLPFKLLSLRKRLREWYLEAQAKKGHGSASNGLKRCDWDPQVVSPELLAWILDGWPNKQLVLALDPTNFGDRFTVLNISVLYRGCAVPVIWTVLEGGKPGAWEPHWERMLKALASQVGPGWQVLVLTDRGMYSPRLFGCLRDLDWHPFLRIRAQGYYRPIGSSKWFNLKDLRLELNKPWSCRAEVFMNRAGRLTCTLVGIHTEGHEEPWLIVTDLLPEVAQASWYGLRGWIEQGYKRVKGEGVRLPRTRILDCKRLERLWLAVAVATMWVLEVGGEAEEAQKPGCPKNAQAKKTQEDTPGLPDLGASTNEQTKKEEKETTDGAAKRTWSVFARGWNVLRNALAIGVLVLGCWLPEPWPNHPAAGLPPTTKTAAAKSELPGPNTRLQPPLNRSCRFLHQLDSS